MNIEIGKDKPSSLEATFKYKSKVITLQITSQFIARQVINMSQIVCWLAQSTLNSFAEAKTMIIVSQLLE
ncbi:hypothetical protein [Shewanella gelidii]|uniref:Uncharacterized protein n=1 Tax=Shewanella gelidii TaxID=1642821 RepID=A0A917NAX9_9GAMM|nr:hypothetical protein [Shewanella gelidii]MCL1098323.1 hypothetical protein [Shewanella gelidii]GGI84381.1 hypothetical protein GCM10009332_22030 [Shewanella gelidii]